MVTFGMLSPCWVQAEMAVFMGWVSGTESEANDVG